VVAQEVEKGSGVAGARAEMQVGYPRGAHTPGGRRFDDAHIFEARRFSERVHTSGGAVRSRTRSTAI